MFANYSPEYPCLLNGLTRFNPIITAAFGGRLPALNLNSPSASRSATPTSPGDQPAYVANGARAAAG